MNQIAHEERMEETNEEEVVILVATVLGGAAMDAVVSIVVDFATHPPHPTPYERNRECNSREIR
jgi:hypothetical protein